MASDTTPALAVHVDQGISGGSESVSRDFNDDVSNPTTVAFEVADSETHAAFIDSVSHTIAQSVVGGNAHADADFATGDIQTRQGPQAWLDYMDWTFAFADPRFYISDCGMA